MGASSKKKVQKKAGTSRVAKTGGRVAAVDEEQSPLKLSIRGFKSLRDRVEVELRPLTLLSGRNSSGKSSLMQPLLLLKQTLEAPFDYGPLRLDGPNVHFSEAQQLFWQGKSQNDRAVEIGIAIGNKGKCEFVFVRRDRGLTLDRVEIHSDDGNGQILREGTVHQQGLFLGLLVRRKFHILAEVPNLEMVSGYNAIMIREQIVADLTVQRLIHVPGLRGNPERFYPSTAVGDRFPGPFPPYTASVLAHWMNEKDERLVTVAEQLRALGLTWKVDARRLDDTRLELRVARTYEPQRGGTKDLVNIADVGFGVSQVLPVLVALLVAKKGDIVHIEQPEIHLHPAAQARLAQPLAAAAKRGVIVVAETHSPLLLRSVQQLVADGSLPARDVALHWFRRDDDGATQVTTAELHRDGTYGDWPEDFASTEMDVDVQLLAAMAGE